MNEKLIYVANNFERTYVFMVGKLLGKTIVFEAIIGDKKIEYELTRNEIYEIHKLIISKTNIANFVYTQIYRNKEVK